LFGIDAGQQACLDAIKKFEQGRLFANIRVGPSIHGAKNLRGRMERSSGSNDRQKLLSRLLMISSPPMGWDQSLLDAGPQGWQDGEHVHQGRGWLCSTTFSFSRSSHVNATSTMATFFIPKISVDVQRYGVRRSRAPLDGVVIEAHHLLFEHMHPDCHINGAGTRFDLVHAFAGTLASRVRCSL